MLRRGRLLEAATLGWNVLGIAILAIAALAARSVALAGFGLDSLIEVGASTVVLWELSGAGEARQRRALRLIAAAFVGLAIYLIMQTVVLFATGYHPHHSPLGIAWTALTAAAMFTLAAGKSSTGRALNNPVLTTENRVTVIDGLLACAVLLGLALNALLGWWWADPADGLFIVYYAIKEAHPSTPSANPHPPAPVRTTRLDMVRVEPTPVAVTTGPTLIRFCDTGTITPAEARKLAGALVELADWAEGMR